MPALNAVVGGAAPVLLQEPGQVKPGCRQVRRIERAKQLIVGDTLVEAVHEGHEPLRAHEFVEALSRSTISADPW